MTFPELNYADLTVQELVCERFLREFGDTPGVPSVAVRRNHNAPGWFLDVRTAGSFQDIPHTFCGLPVRARPAWTRADGEFRDATLSRRLRTLLRPSRLPRPSPAAALTRRK